MEVEVSSKTCEIMEIRDFNERLMKNRPAKQPVGDFYSLKYGFAEHYSNF